MKVVVIILMLPSMSVDPVLRSNGLPNWPLKNYNYNASVRAKIGAQFRELMQDLAIVSEECWLKISEVGDYTLKVKKNNDNDKINMPLVVKRSLHP